MRLACLHVPGFPLAARHRAEPQLRGTPLAVTEGRGPRARIAACSPEAERRGVSVGLSAAQGAAICADLLLRPASADIERAAQEALCDVAHSFSPRVEDAGAGVVYLDGEGLCAVHGSESELARDLVARAALAGLDASAGIASSKIAARLAARDGGGTAVIPPHQEWRFLAPLPIDTLEPGPELRETFARWGIRRLGDLAALPASAVATRLGPEAARLARRARGEEEDPLVPRPSPVHFEEAVELDYGVESLQPFVFVARALLDRLTVRVALRGLLCGDLRLSLRLADRRRVERTVPVAVPSNDGKALLTLLRLHLEAHPPPAAVESIRLAAVPERLRPAQLDLFRPRGPSPARLALTLARLTALCGADRLGAPMVADSHRPDAYATAPFEGNAADGARNTGTPANHPPVTGHRSPVTGHASSSRDHVPLALRAVRPPQELEVFCDRGRPDFLRPAGTPAHPPPGHRSPVTGHAPSPYRCHGRIVSMAGPWRTQGEWWLDGGFSRDYYDVQLSDGVLYRLFFDRRTQRWFVDGVYD
jgi:protein ImuB